MNKITSSSVFTDVRWSRQQSDTTWDSSNGEAINVRAIVPPDMSVVMVGEGDALGNWAPAKGIPMICRQLPLWYLPKDQLRIADGTQYKFVIVRTAVDNEVVCWENGENRRWHASTTDCGSFCGEPDFRPRLSGVAIPVFSIRAEGCEGIGDFTSLGQIAQWAAATGMQVVQTLPVNDTTITHTWTDSYPYKAISVFALHPLYIRVSQIDPTSDVSALLNVENNTAVDYDTVDQQKWRLFREIYARIGKATIESTEFKEFFAHNCEWLRPYAAFCFLRDKYCTAQFNNWPAPYNVHSSQIEEKIIADNADQIGLYYFLQFHADRQLRAARDKAHSLGVVFKGDIPIGVSRDSVDVWVDPHLFNLNGQAGAPPDDFSVDGQNWGFPTYNWQAMASDNYLWWRRRFEKMADYFDMYRIDHILGFFRIWEIPMPEKSGLMGHFVPSLPFSRQELANWGLPMYEERYVGVDDSDRNTLFVRDHQEREMYHPRIAAHSTDRYQHTLDAYEKEKFNSIYTQYFYHRHNDFWAGQALAKLPSLTGATRMLCCAEDLGMIPDCVGWTLRELQIVTLEIQRMPKDPKVEFGNTSLYPYTCVATTSTHDMNPLRLWWTEDRGKTQRYYNDVMHWHGEAPAEATPEICEHIVMQHLTSPAMAVILPLQDWLSIDGELRAADPATERINIPAITDHYWQYRMHLPTERLIASKQYNERLSDMIRYHFPL